MRPLGTDGSDWVQLDLWMAYRPRALCWIDPFESCILGAFIFFFLRLFSATPALIGLAGKAILRGLVSQLTVSFLVID